MKEWFVNDPSDFVAVLVSFVVVYAAIIGLTRITGLRSFSKMSAPDFAMTVAVGSLFASSISTKTPQLPIAVFAFACLFFGQWGLAWLRRRLDRARGLLDNRPLLLMDGTGFREENMRTAHVARSDVIAKLREANVLRTDQIRAVVFETTGDISVLHGQGDGVELEDWILDGVRR